MTFDVNTLATERAEAAKLIDQAVDWMQRAAVCLDGAADHVRRSGLPTDGSRRTLLASRDTLKDQIEIDLAEYVELVGKAAEADRAAAAPDFYCSPCQRYEPCARCGGQAA